MNLFVEIGPDGRTSLIRLAGPELVRHCLEGAVLRDLRFDASEGRPPQRVLVTIRYGGPNAQLPQGMRLPTECDGELQRRRLPLAVCNQGEAAAPLEGLSEHAKDAFESAAFHGLAPWVSGGHTRSSRRKRRRARAQATAPKARGQATPSTVSSGRPSWWLR